MRERRTSCAAVAESSPSLRWILFSKSTEIQHILILMRRGKAGSSPSAGIGKCLHCRETFLFVPSVEHKSAPTFSNSTGSVHAPCSLMYGRIIVLREQLGGDKWLMVMRYRCTKLVDLLLCSASFYLRFILLRKLNTAALSVHFLL